MAAVYKSLSKSSGPKVDKDKDGGNGSVERKNKQRVLILSSRGVTYRYAMDQFLDRGLSPANLRSVGTGISSMT